MIGVEFADLARVSLNAAMQLPGPRDAIILKLKRVDPNLACSRVLGYQLSATTIFLEDIEHPHEFYNHLIARGRGEKWELESR